MLIAIDHGNSAVKTPDFVFASALEKYPSRPPLAGDYLEYDGYVWALSEDRIPYKMDKTENENFFILSLFAIAKHLQKHNAFQPYLDIDLAVGLPPEHYCATRSQATLSVMRSSSSTTASRPASPSTVCSSTRRHMPLSSPAARSC